MNAEEKNTTHAKTQELHAGHRQRMLERFEESENSLHDHELLEILLFYVIPRHNTNPIAHALIEAFGSLSGVFRASMEELLLVKGVGKATAQYIRSIALCFSRINAKEGKFPHVLTPQVFGNYLMEKYRGNTAETLEIFCIDKQNHVFFRKEFSVGKSDEVNVNPRELTALLLAQKTHTVIAAHNHPYTSSSPSLQDDRFTRQLCMLCLMNNVKLGDHMIVGSDGVFSYHASGRLDEIVHECAHIDLN